MTQLCFAVVLALSFGATAKAQESASSRGGFRIVYDDFKNGFSATGADAKWFYFSAGSFVGDDGIETTDRNGLRVVSKGRNPFTGQPAFTKSLAQEHENGGIPGGVDHVKWLVYATHPASSGYPGFDAVPGRTIACESWIGGRTFGTQFQPFGPLVDNPNDDLRLAAFAQNAIDLETFMVFDFFVTNERIYAFYERLPFGRGIQGNPDNYAAFSYNIPVWRRTPGDSHHLKTEYDRGAGTVTWYVDGWEVFKVNHLGRRIDRRYMTLDHGGVEQDVSPRQLDCGMGTFTLLDAYRPTDVGLVRLSDSPNFYFNPDVGQPVPEPFYDNQSRQSDRLFGQGAELRVKRYVVSSRPSGHHAEHEDEHDGD